MPARVANRKQERTLHTGRAKAKGLFDKFTKKKLDDKEVIPAYSKYYKDGEPVAKAPEPGSYAG